MPIVTIAVLMPTASSVTRAVSQAMPSARPVET